MVELCRARGSSRMRGTRNMSLSVMHVLKHSVHHNQRGSYASSTVIDLPPVNLATSRELRISTRSSDRDKDR